MKKKHSEKMMHKGAKEAHKMHKEILRHHSKLMGAHAKLEKHIKKMAGGGNAGGAQISTGKKNEKSRPDKSEIISMDEGKRGRKKSSGY